MLIYYLLLVFFFQADDGIRVYKVTGVQTCALPIPGAARSRGSSTMTAAPSPSTRPDRVFENGRQVSLLITRNASQPRSVPNVMQASVPPAMASGAWPQRTIWKACPIAWVADAHALATE